MRKGNKRGQFYLVAAIIIVAVIIGLAGVSNYAKQQPKVTVYDLGEELNIESGEVVQYGVFNYAGDDNNLMSFLGNFTELYTQYAGEGKDLYFVYGDESNVVVLKYEDVLKGEISVGESSTYKVKGKVVKEEQQTPNENMINVTIGETNHQFTLTPGENFYYVLAEEVGNEKHIVSSQ